MKTEKIKVFLVEANDWEDSFTIGVCSTLSNAIGMAHLFCKKSKLKIVYEKQYEDDTLYIRTVDKRDAPDRTIVITEYQLDKA